MSHDPYHWLRMFFVLGCIIGINAAVVLLVLQLYLLIKR